jgi:hypothetical protein
MTIRPDGNKIQEIKDHFKKLGDSELAQMLKKVREVEEDPERELMENEINDVRQKHEFQSAQYLYQIMMMQPEKLFKSGWGFNTEGVDGWRNGYTKSPIKKRVQKRRTQKKLAKITRRQQRK